MHVAMFCAVYRRDWSNTSQIKCMYGAKFLFLFYVRPRVIYITAL